MNKEWKEYVHRSVEFTEAVSHQKIKINEALGAKELKTALQSET